MATNAENVSIWWRHALYKYILKLCITCHRKTILVCMPMFSQTRNTVEKSNPILFIILQGLALLTLSQDKNWDSHSPVNGYPSFYPRIAIVAPSPGENRIWLPLQTVPQEKWVGSHAPPHSQPPSLPQWHARNQQFQSLGRILFRNDNVDNEDYVIHAPHPQPPPTPLPPPPASQLLIVIYVRYLPLKNKQCQTFMWVFMTHDDIGDKNDDTWLNWNPSMDKSLLAQ